MYPRVPCGSQDVQTSSLSWETTLIPGSDRRALLKSNAPSIWEKADNFGLMQILMWRFNYILAAHSNQNHEWSGKQGSTVAILAMKLFLKVLMDRSAGLV